jgi:hypothetical protein
MQSVEKTLEPEGDRYMIRKIPFLLAILGMVGGVFIAILFAVNEDMFQERIRTGLAANQKIQAMADGVEKQAKINSESDKNWRYYQRFHFHATGIGAMMMGLLIFLLILDAPAKLATAASYLVSVGGFLYPFVWLFAGIYGPEMGRNEAKEAFAVFGYMGGVFLVGGILALFLGVRYPFKKLLT